jgi:hypothetical protein
MHLHPGGSGHFCSAQDQSREVSRRGPLGTLELANNAQAFDQLHTILYGVRLRCRAAHRAAVQILEGPSLSPG